MTAACDDLRIGGTLSAAGISGGLSINSTALYVTDWTNLFGFAGVTGTAWQVTGRPGAYFAGDLLGRPRFPILSMGISRYNATGGLTAPTPEEQLWDNTDQFLTYLNDIQYIEYDLPDGEQRFIQARALDAAPIFQPRRARTMSVGLVTVGPYWRRGGAQSSQVINGVDTMAIQGTAPVYDAVLSFAAAGTFTHSGEGWSIEATGAGYPLLVDLGNRTVTQGGNPVSNRIRRDSRDWGWFPVGTNNVMTDVAVTVTWRSSYV